jgi:hypothetical protein
VKDDGKAVGAGQDESGAAFGAAAEEDVELKLQAHAHWLLPRIQPEAEFFVKPKVALSSDSVVKTKRLFSDGWAGSPAALGCCSARLLRGEFVALDQAAVVASGEMVRLHRCAASERRRIA